MRHDIRVDLTPKPLGEKGEVVIEEEEIPFEWDDEKLYLRIAKLNEGDLEELEFFELSSKIPDMAFEGTSC
eukprot:8968823-Ditylum_brightwellii.AAC.1